MNQQDSCFVSVACTESAGEPTSGEYSTDVDTNQAVRRWRVCGRKLEAAVAHIDRLTVEIIRRSDLTAFVVLPRRWVVERTLAWLNRCQCLAKDWEASVASSEAWMVVSAVRRMTRCIAKLRL
jgi:transposase